MTFSIASHACDVMVTRTNVQINASIRQQSCENEEPPAFLENSYKIFFSVYDARFPYREFDNMSTCRYLSMASSKHIPLELN